MKNNQQFCPARHADVQIIVRDAVDTTYTLNNGDIHSAEVDTNSQKTFVTYCPDCGLWKMQRVSKMPTWLRDIISGTETEVMLLERRVIADRNEK